MPVMTERKFAIFDDIRGVAESVPSVKIKKAYSPDSENVFLKYGTARRQKGRLKELLESAYTTGTISVTEGSATVTGLNTVWYTSSTHYPCWGSDDLSTATGRTITIESVEYTIKSVDTATQLTLNTNYAGSTDTGLSYSIGTANQKVITPDGNPIIAYHDHFSAAGSEYLFARTEDKIYLWDTTWSAFIDKTISGGWSAATEVTIRSFRAKVLMTDGVNKFAYWPEGTPGNLFDNVGSANGLDLDGGSTYLTAAKYMEIYEGYVVLAYTTEGGTTYPYTMRWCTLNDETDWNESGSGDTGAKAFNGQYRLKGLGLYTARGANLLIVFRERQGHPYKVWSVETADVFNTGALEGIGLLSNHSVVNSPDGDLYYIASDYTVRKLYYPIPISTSIDPTMKLINPTYQDYIESTYVDKDNLLTWSIPYGPDATSNNRLISWDLTEQVWYVSSFAVRAFGSYHRQSAYTIDTIPYTTIDGIEWPAIDTVENIVGFPLDICSDYSGYTYDLNAAEKDATAAYTGKLVLSTDLADKQALAWYKRANNLQFWFNAEGTNDFTVAIYAKEDGEASWASLGNVSLNGSGKIVIYDLPCDLRAHNFEIKMEATNKFEFIGLVVSYEPDGDR